MKEKYKRKRKPYTSPMQIEFWIKRINPKTQKFYSVDEANFHIRSFRKTNIEYWLVHGYNEKDAKKKLFEHQSLASKAAWKNRPNHPEYSNVHIEYWLAKGYSEKEAKQKLKERQATFSLKKCIEQYGEVEGIKRFNQRQNKWQQSLKIKPKKEIDKINKNKNVFGWFYNYKKLLTQEYWKKWKKICEIRGMVYIDNEVELKKYVTGICLMTKYIHGKSINWILSKCIPQYLWRVLHIKKSIIISWIEELNIQFSKAYLVGENNKIRSYHQLLPSGKILRSSHEILFFQLLIKNGIIKFEVGDQYPNSRMMYDFCVNGYYIEIAGLMNDEIYRSKMQFKRNTFKAFILIKRNDYQDFIKRVLIDNDKEAIDYYLTRPL